MKIQTLVSTVNRDNIDFLKDMKIETDVVIGNQNGQISESVLAYNSQKILLVNSKEKGLAKNRNLTISKSDADICVLADDDIEYCPGYSKTIENAFLKQPDAEIIIFNLYENPIERYVIKDNHRVRGIDFLRYGSVRIAFRRESILGKIRFDERFGAGGEIPIGEDTIFLCDCLRKGIKIYTCPEYILRLKPSESTWFNGYNKEYFINKGKMYKRMFGMCSEIIIIQDAVRHRRQYSSWSGVIGTIRLMNIGKRDFTRQ